MKPDEPLLDDCYHRAIPGEYTFTLLARDPLFAMLVRIWADHREQAIAIGDRPASDRAQVVSARLLAARAAEWRRDNYNRWREPTI